MKRKSRDERDESDTHFGELLDQERKLGAATPGLRIDIGSVLAEVMEDLQAVHDRVYMLAEAVEAWERARQVGMWRPEPGAKKRRTKKKLSAAS